jgi:hypothetical protein
VVHIILFAVLAQAMVPPVVLSLFLLHMPSFIFPGLVAPPYHLNQLLKIFVNNKIDRRAFTLFYQSQ